MSELDVIRDWFAFNAHARRGYIESFARLPNEELTRDRGASYPTMLSILEHTLGAYCFWIARASRGNTSLPQTGPWPDTGPDPSLDEISGFEQQVQALVERFLGGLDEEDLDLTFQVKMGGAFTRDHGISVREMLWHLVEEELQHRGELNALLWQIDVDPPIFDWVDWVESPARAQRRGSTHAV